MNIHILIFALTGFQMTHVESWVCSGPVQKEFIRPGSNATFTFRRTVVEAFSHVSILRFDGKMLAQVLFTSSGDPLVDTITGVTVIAVRDGLIQITLQEQLFREGMYIASSFHGATCTFLYSLGIPRKPSITGVLDPSVGSAATINCTCTSTTSPSNHSLSMISNWFVNNSLIRSMLNVTYLVTGTQLKLRRVTREDATKQFTCSCTEVVAEGFTSALSDPVLFDIHYGPESMSLLPNETKHEVEEHTIFLPITCDAECNPPCRFVWTKVGDGSTVSNTAILELGVLTREHVGTYRCTATRIGVLSGTKDLTLVIRYAPTVRIRQLPSNQPVLQNKEVLLFCEVTDGVPPVYRYNGFIHTYGSEIIEDIPFNVPGTPVNSSLLVSSAQFHDTGTYTCSVSNGIRTNGSLYQKASVYLKVKAVPVFALGNENMQFYTTVENTLVVEISWFSYPELKNMTIIRSYDGAIVIHSDKYNIHYKNTTFPFSFHSKNVSLNGTRISISFNNITTDDFGKYRFVISNEVGFSYSVFEILQKVRPSPPTGIKGNIVSGMAQLSWFGSFNGGDKQVFLIQKRQQDKDLWENVSVVEESDPANTICERYYQITLSNLTHAFVLFRIVAVNSIGPADAVYFNATMDLVNQPAAMTTEAMISDNTFIVGIVLGVIIICLGVCLTIIVVKLRNLKNSADNLSSKGSKRIRQQPSTYANIAYAGDTSTKDSMMEKTDKQTSDIPARKGDETYTSLNTGDSSTYDVIKQNQ